MAKQSEAVVGGVEHQPGLDAIRLAARDQGVDEILRYTAGVDLDWKQILSAGQALSLFSSKRLLAAPVSQPLSSCPGYSPKT